MASEADFMDIAVEFRLGLSRTVGRVYPKKDKNLEGAIKRSLHAWKIASSLGSTRADSRLSVASSLINLQVLAPSDFQKSTPKE
jgi:hypothetical protein